MCDASAVVPLSRSSVLVADDEDNTLRAYDVDRAGAPSSLLDLSQPLGLPVKVHKDGRASSREMDIEASARLGSTAYFLTSHGRDSRGRLREERLKFFAVDVADPQQLRVTGSVYGRLLDDLLHEPRLASYGLAEASLLPPKAPGGLNLEGMTARVEGGVWLGFRNPVPAGRALLVPLLNPEALVQGQPA
ncbi:MAG TPA: hypothetical protein VEQ58_17050, partial [Polyangiaceae bacterium]|nr:hypothetical protein [Polyangiaceae bacterium]